MRSLAAVLVVAVAALPVALGARHAEADGSPLAQGRWARDFHDGFDGSQLDREHWATCYWWDDGGCTNQSTPEQQWYVPGQVSVSGGALHLTATPQASRHLDQGFAYASGMVSSGRIGDTPADAARYAFTYGYVEVRFRTPAGAGLWPAIWMLPVTNRSLPEIDLMEQYGDEPDKLSMTLHAAPGTGGEPVARAYATGTDLSAGWHTLGLDWQPGRLRWLVDGVERFRVEGDRVPSEPMYLLMNLAVGGQAGAPDAGTAFPATFQIDDVAVWRQS